MSSANKRQLPENRISNVLSAMYDNFIQNDAFTGLTNEIVLSADDQLLKLIFTGFGDDINKIQSFLQHGNIGNVVV